LVAGDPCIEVTVSASLTVNQNDSLSEISFGKRLSDVSNEDADSEQEDSDSQISKLQGKYILPTTSRSLVSTKLAQRITQDELDWLN
jgi:hypothetical protein